ncbi:microtubule-associated protein futsch isoform X1 [Euwallacea fornicatus]|uniref:microtubule-associated protein futsch isoform X1 n=1 Tax=Euwallacea fornicatus TaxID=995702 RepID=UPI00338E3C15
MDEISEEIAKEGGHRPSVSMPSLDSSEYFPTLTTNSENEEFIPTDTLAVESASGAPQEAQGAEATSETSIESEAPNSFINEDSEEPLINSEHLNQALSSESEVLSEPAAGTVQSELEDSQVEEDPSIAIDQFIQKIADEQLSSKRIEERQEEEAKEQDEVAIDMISEPPGSSLEQMDTLERSVPNETEKDKEPQEEARSVSPIITEKVSEAMEVDENTDYAQKGDSEHMAESIEEIQKELEKNPPKKKIPSESNGCKVQDAPVKDNQMQAEEKQIEDILAGKDIGDILETSLLKDNTPTPTIQDSADVAKDPALIEKAQEDIKNLDVLVCGGCHNSFHYIQEFSNHKKGNCTKTSVLIGVCEVESKPQTWGFILWKSKHLKNYGDEVPSSWAIYQKWCKLPQADMNAWITAGQSIQFASKIANAKVTEVRPGIKPVKQTIVQKVVQTASPPLELVESNKENSNIAASNINRKSLNKPVQLNNDVTIMPSTKKNEFVVEKIMAKRFNPRKKTWEYNIKWENFGHDSNTWEPINNLSHCKKLLEQFEEQLKRMKEEKAKHSQTPKGRGRPSNAKSVATKSVSNFVPIAPKISNIVGGVSEDYGGDSSSRPQRFSKQKAMSQVKEWCGNISDDESAGSLKRKYETDDSDEDFDDKKIKLEDDSDDSSKFSKSKISTKKGSTSKTMTTKSPISVRNGNNTQQALPSNILIPDANGVVRINQKQLPSLSSGVYIMSKTAGIIKLDSNTSKVATSGGQTIVKVAPKIGQTQIKIVKKDGNTTKQIIHVAPKIVTTPMKTTAAKPGTAQKATPKLKKEVKRINQTDTTPKPVLKEKRSETPPPLAKQTHDSDSDDGLEPLPFPDADEPIPDVAEEEPNEDFVLDPETGKIAGVEYVDKPVVIKTEPSPLPPTTSELENIVKMAAANISDDDVQDSGSQDDPLFKIEKESKPIPLKKPEPKPTGGTIRKVVKYTIGGQTVRTETQILNKTLASQNKPLLNVGPPRLAVQQPQPRRVVQQKVINQMVSQRAPVQQPRTVVRHVIEPTRPSQGGINVVRKTVSTTPKSKFSVTPPKRSLPPTKTYSALGGIRHTSPSGGTSKTQFYTAKSGSQPMTTTFSGGVRRIGNTVVRPAISTQKAPVTRIIQRVASSPKKSISQQPSYSQLQTRTVGPTKPRMVINMPSLTEDDIPSMQGTKQASKAAPAGQKPSPAVQKSAPAVQKSAPKPVVPKPEIKIENTASEAVKVSNEDTLGVEDTTDWSSFTMADNDNPIYVTGDDGTIYQVAGQNEQGQTILITQGPDGQQQCLLVTSEIGEVTSEDRTVQPNTNTAVTPELAESALLAQPQENELSIPPTIAAPEDESIQTPLQIKTDPAEMEGIEEGQQDQVVAQVVRTEPPSPGGTHKVVVMLPDGNLMVTQVSPEEYASLELE